MVGKSVGNEEGHTAKSINQRAGINEGRGGSC